MISQDDLFEIREIFRTSRPLGSESPYRIIVHPRRAAYEREVERAEAAYTGIALAFPFHDILDEDPDCALDELIIVTEAQASYYDRARQYVAPLAAASAAAHLEEHARSTPALAYTLAPVPMPKILGGKSPFRGRPWGIS